MLTERTIMKLNLSLTDELSYVVENRTSGNHPLLTVNRKGCYFLRNALEPGYPFTVKRSIRGTFLKIPALNNWECTLGPDGVIT